jgi:asparagine synthase (glutamine-hydrolysing)
MYQYVAFVWNPAASEGRSHVQALRNTIISQGEHWLIAHESAGLLVFHTGVQSGSARAHVLQNDSGIVLGTLFNRNSINYAIRPSINFNDAESELIATSRGQHLIDQYWGSYFAIICDTESQARHIFRDPTSSIGCYRINHRSIDIFFSSIDNCVNFLPISFTVNKRYLARWLMHSQLMSSDCGIEDVEELRGGERLTLSGDATSRQVIWNPAEIARRARFDDPHDAARKLRSTVQDAVDAWASCYSSIMLTLSGGLDSSIVAACVSRSPSKPKVNALNIAIIETPKRLRALSLNEQIDDKLRSLVSAADERYYARLVAQKFSIRLAERGRNAAGNFKKLWRTPLSVNPASCYGLAMDIDDIETEFATACNARACFTGVGGDEVFLSTMQPIAAIDYAYTQGLRLDLWQHAVAAARLSRSSVWQVLGEAFRYGFIRGDRSDDDFRSSLNRPQFLNKEFMDQFSVNDFVNYWTSSASHLPPGKIDHISGIAYGPRFQSTYLAKQLDQVDVLNGQPIWELLLQIPTYTLLTGGISRGLARLAFADTLPPEILKRSLIKGDAGPFIRQLIRENLSLFREILSGGLLAQEGILNRRTLDEFLSANEARWSDQIVELPYLASAEIWLQQWASIRRNISDVA